MLYTICTLYWTKSGGNLKTYFLNYILYIRPLTTYSVILNECVCGLCSVWNHPLVDTQGTASTFYSMMFISSWFMLCRKSFFLSDKLHLIFCFLVLLFISVSWRNFQTLCSVFVSSFSNVAFIAWFAWNFIDDIALVRCYGILRMYKLLP